jgi:hypothetical protein
MSKRILAVVAAVGIGAGLAPQARAQVYARPATNPFQPPAVSPYLNLARGGDRAINYYGLVKPQEQTHLNILQLQQQQAATGQAVMAGETNLALPYTGHPTRFFNYSHYFFNQGGAGYYGAGVGAPYGAGLGGAPFTANYPPHTGLGISPVRPLR